MSCMSPSRSADLAQEHHHQIWGFGSRMSMQWSTWSPDLGGDCRIPRRILQVPKDQQLLLDRDDSWYPRRSAIAPVPEAVLNAAKEAYLESKKAPPRPEKKQQSPACAPAPPVPSPQPVLPPATARQSRKRSAPPDFDDDDSRDSEVSWPSSPSRHFRAASSQDPEPMEGVETLPIQHLPTSRSPSRPVRRRPPQPVPPPSSSQASVELEIEVPLAITSVPQPAPPKTTLRPLGPTPPSAQVIPSTFKSMESPAQPRTKPMRHMEDISSRFSPPLAELATPMPPTSTAMGTMGMTATSPAFTSSNVAPPSPSPVPSRPVIKDPARTLQNSSSSDKPPPNGPPSQVPYVAFRTAYPDFPATLNDFLRAVLAVQDLQKQSRVPEFLYDDYIRVFCGDYMDYVKNRLQRDPTAQTLPILTIFKYYNENVSIPEYTQRIIHRANLSDVLDCYATDIAALSNGVRVSGKNEPAASDKRRSFSFRDSGEPRKHSIEMTKPPVPPVEVVQLPVQNAEVIKPPPHRSELAFDPIEIAEPTQPQPPRKPFSRSTSINSLSNRSFAAAAEKTIEIAEPTQPQPPRKSFSRSTSINSLSNRSFTKAAVPAPEKTLPRRVSPVREAPPSILPSIEVPRPSKANPRPPKRLAVAVSPMETQPRMPSPILGHDMPSPTILGHDRRKTFPMASATTSIETNPPPSHLAPSTAGTTADETTIPETVARPKSSSRGGGGVPTGSARSTKSRKSAAALTDPAERKRQWRKHLESNLKSRRQSSASGNSGSGGGAPAYEGRGGT